MKAVIIICTFAPAMKQLFNKYKHLLGMLLIVLGVTLMTAAYLLGWTAKNWVTLPCLLLVVAGATCHVVIMKRQSKY